MNWRSLYQKAKHNIERWDIIKEDDSQVQMLDDWLLSLGISPIPKKIRCTKLNKVSPGLPPEYWKLDYTVSGANAWAACVNIIEGNPLGLKKKKKLYSQFTSKRTAYMVGLKKCLEFLKRLANHMAYKDREKDMHDVT